MFLAPLPLKLFRCWLRDFGSLGILFLKTQTREDQLFVFTRDLLPEEAIVTNLATCQGRDHFVNTQSGKHNFVIVNVHFEPGGYVEAITWQIASYSPALPCVSQCCGHYLGEEGRFNVWNQTFTDGDPVRLPCSTLSFHTSLRLPNLITQEGTPRPLGSYALFQG